MTGKEDCEMSKHVAWRVVLAALAVLTVCPVARAIPPPWLLEGMKAKSDLILVARMTKTEAAANAGRYNSRIGFEPVEILKGKIDKKKDEEPKLFVLYHKRPEMLGTFRPHVIGGTGNPRPADGELALVFLKGAAEDKHFTVVCGSFGYISLKAATQDDLAKVKQRLAGFRKTCERINDKTVRETMDGYYQKTLELVEKQAKKEEKK